MFIEDVNVLIRLNFIVKPVVCQHIFSCSSLVWLFLKHSFHEVNSLLTNNVFFVLYFLVELFDSVQVANLISLERYIAIKHCIQTNSCAPYVNWKALVPHVFYNFWSYIGRSSTLLKQYFVLFNLS